MSELGNYDAWKLRSPYDDWDEEPEFHCDECEDAGFVWEGELCPACQSTCTPEDLDEIPPCSLGVGCDEYGVCYAATHGQPDMCGRQTPPARQL